MILYSKVTAQPGTEPVTLEEAKAYLKMSGIDAEDALITSLIVTARKQCEIETGLSIITQTRQIKMDKFPSGLIIVPYGPVSAITTFGYVDSNGDSQTLTLNTDFRADLDSDLCRLEPIDSWPSTKRQINAVSIIYQAGYANAGLVPQNIKDIILRIVVELHSKRGDESQSGFNVTDYITLRMIDNIKVTWNAHY